LRCVNAVAAPVVEDWGLAIRTVQKRNQLAFCNLRWRKVRFWFWIACIFKNPHAVDDARRQFAVGHVEDTCAWDFVEEELNAIL
jgi:hypothetical protein